MGQIVMSQFPRVLNTDSKNKGPKIKELKSSRIEIEDTSSFEDYQDQASRSKSLITIHGKPMNVVNVSIFLYECDAR